MIPTFVVLVLQAFLALSSCGQVLTNTTIDDTNLQYWSYGTESQGKWTAVTAQTPCSGCSAQPDPSQAYDQSWHDGYRTTGAFTFQVYIYGIDWQDDSNVTFSMENPPNAPITGFHYHSDPGSYAYNVLFFSATGLDPTVSHTVNWLNTPTFLDNGSMLFDYAVVTVDSQQSSSSAIGIVTSGTSLSLCCFPPPPQSSPSFSTLGNRTSLSISQSSSASSQSSSQSSSASSQSVPPPPPPPSPKSKSKTGAIVGAVVGVVGVLALLGVPFIFWRRRHSSMDSSVNLQLVSPYLSAVMSETHPAPEVSVPSQPTSPSNLTRSLVGDPHPNTPGSAAPDPKVQLEERVRNLEDLLISQPPAYT
ncbi:hypothetical protein DFH07DRAFT_766363 [Mycena maculata]|uniref:Uncharacterized protein n=1 Tax=Mycena maculata TaxID=230809 RepID=A0AAD7NW98_9AGAR|nr:hypothetical protein DFH07DRAFT_766363 [Mycena maculata]